jgi:hypothetical protein
MGKALTITIPIRWIRENKGDFAEFFDFGTGIFAGVLFALSLIAYRTQNKKNSIRINCVRTVCHPCNSIKTQSIIPVIESSALELILSIMEFVALVLFFVAIMKKESVKLKQSTRDYTASDFA